MVLGICVVDAMNVYKYHVHPLHRHKNVELLSFVNMLIEDLLANKESKIVVHDRDRAMVIGDFWCKTKRDCCIELICIVN